MVFRVLLEGDFKMCICYGDVWLKVKVVIM